MEFWLSGSLSHELLSFHNGISAITKPFTQTFLFFFTMESWLSGSLFTNFSFTMESRLSRSLSHELFFFFSRWNLSYQEAFSRFFLSQWNLGYHEVLHTMEFTKCTILGKTLFIYIIKSICIGSALLKTLPLDLEPPLQGKKSTVLLILMQLRKKLMFFLRNNL
jgi:hypothetical protein